MCVGGLHVNAFVDVDVCVHMHIYIYTVSINIYIYIYRCVYIYVYIEGALEFSRIYLQHRRWDFHEDAGVKSVIQTHFFRQVREHRA